MIIEIILEFIESLPEDFQDGSWLSGKHVRLMSVCRSH